ncbi:MAG: ECF transporter S component [Bacillota bacterium]|nr:ECF transporter S component [Bacillota bacterium]
MTLTHVQKRARIATPPLADLGWALVGAVAYGAVGAAANLLLPQLALFRPAAAVLVLSALLRGPVVGFGTGFLGDLLVGAWQGGVWLHWSLGVGLAGAVIGLLWLWSDLDAAPALTRMDLQKIVFFTCAGFFVGAFFPALVDIILGAALSLALIVWAIPAWLVNAFWGTTLGTLLLVLWKSAASRRLLRRPADRQSLPRRD